MREVGRREFLGAAAVATPLFAFSPASARAPRAAEWPNVARTLDYFVGSGKLPGAVATIGTPATGLSVVARGTLGFDNPRPIDADSLFRLYSMTKPITGIAAMILVDRGQLALDQPIADILPAFAKPRVLVDPLKSLDAVPAKGPITVRHLLTHTAGLGYSIITKGPLLGEYLRLGIVPGAVSRKPMPGVPDFAPASSLAAFADRLASLPLIAEPGTRWSYSVSLDLMGRVIEVVAGKPFDRFLADEIFGPLGMASTGFTVPATQLARLTSNYGFGPGGQRFVMDPGGGDSVFADPPAFPFGGAGLVGSPRDYDRFLAMLAGFGRLGRARILSERTARLAMSDLMPAGVDTKGTFAEGQGFGAGGRVVVRPTPQSGRLGTFGWAGAAATIGFVEPMRGLSGAAYAQFMPDQTLPFTGSVVRAIMADAR